MDLEELQFLWSFHEYHLPSVMGEEMFLKKGPKSSREKGELRTNRVPGILDGKEFQLDQRQIQVYLGKQIHIQGRMGVISRVRDGNPLIFVEDWLLGVGTMRGGARVKLHNFGQFSCTWHCPYVKKAWVKGTPLRLFIPKFLSSASRSSSDVS